MADLGPEFGRDEVWRVARSKENRSRHALPPGLVGRSIGEGRTFEYLEGLIAEGRTVRVTRLTDEFDFAMWRNRAPEAVFLGVLKPDGGLAFLPEAPEDGLSANSRVVSLVPAAGLTEGH